MREVDEPDELVALFSQDSHLHLYALADLEEPYWSASRWWLSGQAAVGLVGLTDGSHVLYAVSSIDPVGTLELVSALVDEVPATLVTGPIGVARIFERAGRTLRWSRSYRRFYLPDSGRAAMAAGSLSERSGLVPLGTADKAEIAELYRTETGSAFFLPSMLADETFVGVRQGSQLMAIAGTHVLSERHDVAAIGAVFTHPKARGQGLGAAVTRGVVDRIGDRVSTIGLNCAESNAAARAVYKSLGFVQGMQYDECELAD